MNKIILCGNICREIEVNHYNDRKVIRNSIAVRRDFKNKNGEYDSDFFNFSVWGVQAEYIEKYASKGDKIIICGKILNNNYEKDGQTIYNNEIQVENVELLNFKSSGNAEKVATELFDDTAIEIDNTGILD